MDNKKIKIFITRLEFFYRNFGNEWAINDFVNDKNENEKFIFKELLKRLEKKGVVKIIDNDFDFKIIDLPSNHNDIY